MKEITEKMRKEQAEDKRKKKIFKKIEKKKWIFGWKERKTKTFQKISEVENLNLNLMIDCAEIGKDSWRKRKREEEKKKKKKEKKEKDMTSW